MRRIWLCVVAALVVVAFPASPSVREREARPADAITASRLRERVAFLTSAALEGRYPGSAGFRFAAAYAASQLSAAGVVPLVESGGGDAFLQAVPLRRRTATDAVVVTVTTPSGARTFAPGALKLFASEGLIEGGKPLEVVFAGFGIHEPSAGWDDLAGLDVVGKAVLVMVGAPVKNGKPVLPEALHASHAPGNALLRRHGLFHGAAAVLAVPDAELAKELPEFPDVPEGPQFVLADEAPGSGVNAALALVSPELASALMDGTDLPDATDADSIRARRGEVPGVTVTIRATVLDEKTETWNVVGLVGGTDPTLRQQVVAVSAHLDHLPPTAEGEVHPGANDDASGAAALLEIARILAAHPPRRSVLFALFGAEEGGSMGARHFLARGPLARDRIVADVNMDMIGRTEKGLEADRAHYALGSGTVTAAFTRLVETVNARSVRWPLRYAHPLNLGSSDHDAFAALAIPAVNFYSGRVAETHQTTDTADRLDYDKAEVIARLVCEIAFELGNRDPLW